MNVTSEGLVGEGGGGGVLVVVIWYRVTKYMFVFKNWQLNPV